LIAAGIVAVQRFRISGDDVLSVSPKDHDVPLCAPLRCPSRAQTASAFDRSARTNLLRGETSKPTVGPKQVSA
jgi:hypothetical protein